MQVLSGLPTTTKQDEAALAALAADESFHTRCRRLALQWRVQHKRSLARAYKLAQASLSVLSSELQP
jgi:hypothetical protein